MRTWFPTALLCFTCGAASLLAQAPAPAPAPAPPAPSYPNVKVGATLFADYTYTASPESTDADGNAYSPSAFTVGRSYINVTGNLSRVVAFRFTPDIVTETTPGSALLGSLVFRVKYAYLQANLGQWLTPGTWVRFGMQGTGYVNFAEDLYRYRFQGPIMVDREGYLSSSDAGVAFFYNLPSNYGELQVGVYNGETYKKVEANDQKSLQIRGTVRPFPKAAPVMRGLRVTGFYNGDRYIKDGERRRAMGSITYEHKYLNGAVEYLSAADQSSTSVKPVDSSGYSAWATPRSTNGWEGLLRYDHLTTNKARNELKTRTIVGVSYWIPLPAGVATAFLLDYEQVAYQRVLPPRPTEKRIALHALVSF
ncbi:MAG: hypothetical protein ABI665_12370 [Vicinamibacterales bacterium]